MARYVLLTTRAMLQIIRRIPISQMQITKLFWLILVHVVRKKMPSLVLNIKVLRLRSLPMSSLY
jgi:hypothetical protein